MTFLPIIERELRGRARGRATYWTRFAVALVGILICLPQFLQPSGFAPMGTIGRSVFNALATLTFVLCCGGCLLTAEAISAERREGTLSLLFLTRVRIFDVMLGKLGSIGLTSLGALMAVLPVLMLPVLAGGVSGGEAMRKGFALLDTLVLALAVGLWSAAGKETRTRPALRAVKVMALLVLVPFCCWLLARPHHWVGVPSPLVAMIWAGQSPALGSGPYYWISLGVIQGLAWLLLAGAGFRLRRAIRQPDDTPLTSSAVSLEEESPGARARAWPVMAESASPVEWLVRRQRGLSATFWLAALLGLFGQAAMMAFSRFAGMGSARFVLMLLSQLPNLMVAMLGAALLAWGASRFFVSTRRSGELELLLTTPLGADTIVSGQWQVLKRLLLLPLLVMMLPFCLRLLPLVLTWNTSFSRWGLHYLISIILGMTNTAFGVGAVCWLGLWFGWKAHGQADAIIRSVVLAKGVPFLITIVGSNLWILLTGGPRGPFGGFWYAISWVLQLGILLFYVCLIAGARRRLTRALAGAEPGKLNWRQSVAQWVQDSMAAIWQARHWTPR